MDAIRYLESELDNSCVVTCLAMVTGQTFQEVLEQMQEYWDDYGQFEGIADDCFDAYLSQLGYALQYMHHDYVPTHTLRNRWPPKPFAPVHICDVFDQGMHCVVMLADGTVLDPNDKNRRQLVDYHRVYTVTGIWKVREPLPAVR